MLDLRVMVEGVHQDKEMVVVMVVPEIVVVEVGALLVAVVQGILVQEVPVAMELLFLGFLLLMELQDLHQVDILLGAEAAELTQLQVPLVLVVLVVVDLALAAVELQEPLTLEEEEVVVVILEMEATVVPEL